jgi:hypothetical protein
MISFALEVGTARVSTSEARGLVKILRVFLKKVLDKHKDSI